MNEFEKSCHLPINPRVANKKKDPNYNSPERVKKRECGRISKLKRYRENEINNLKTKKKHL